MPELPEVEAARRIVERICAGATISAVSTRELGGGAREGQFDDIVFENVGEKSEESYRSALLGNTLKQVHRKGKQLWFEFFERDSPCVLFHFGMTGAFVIKGQTISKYKSFKVDETQWPPRFTKVLMELSNGEQLAFCDPRRLGRIKIRNNPLHTSPLKDLGIDPVNEVIPNSIILKNVMASITSPIKTLLLDQERLFCGIGNYLADEILYQAKIHPECKACSVTEAGINALVTAMKYVLTTAVETVAQNVEFPADWLFHKRWDKGKSKLQKITMPDGNKVVFEEVAGRTTAIVPSVQMRTGPLVSISAAVTKVTKVVVKKERKVAVKAEKDSVGVIVQEEKTGRREKRNIGLGDAAAIRKSARTK